MSEQEQAASRTCQVCHVALNPDMQRDGMCSACYRLSQEAGAALLARPDLDNDERTVQ